MSLAGIDPLRCGPSNDRPINHEGQYVLYWMTGARRLRHNPSLDAAVAQCEALKKPLLIFEPMQIDYRFACERHHRFVVDGMIDQRRRCADLNIRYVPFLESKPGNVKTAFLALCARATCVIGDLHPGGWLDKVTRKAIESLTVRAHLVDSVGLVPLAMAEKNYLRAYDYRRFIARELSTVVRAFPHQRNLASKGLQGAPIPWDSQWRDDAEQTQAILDAPETLTTRLSLSGPAATSMRGGHKAARKRWDAFAPVALRIYGEQRHHPDAQVESRQSPYLHYGQIGAHELLEDLLALQKRDLGQWVYELPDALAAKTSRWGLPEGPDGFVDQLMVWRELGQHLGHRRPEAYDQYRVLPVWAQKTLQEHAQDPRESLVSMQDLESANSPDHLWNAAQTQLLREGHIHNYLRMLWGKRVLAWSATPQEAFERLVVLNNRYALDGRDPNSHSGIGWVFGLFDRPWGPERPIYGKVRYMTTQSTLRKLKLKEYLQHYGAKPEQAQLF